MSKRMDKVQSIIEMIKDLKDVKNKKIELAVQSLNAAEWLLVPNKLKNILKEYRK